MISRIGIGVGADSIRAVVVRGGRIRMANESSRDAHGSLAEAIESILARFPGRRWPGPSVYLSLGPADSQLKRIDEIPLMAEGAVLTGIIREGAGSFFLRNGQPLSTTAGLRSPEGDVWAAAFDTFDIDEIRTACARARARIRMIVPAAVAVPLALRNETVVWADGPYVLEIQHLNGLIGSLRRRRLEDAPPFETQLEPVAQLARLGDGAARFADAFGATQVAPRCPLALGPLGIHQDAERNARGIRSAISLGVAATILAALSPTAALVQAGRAEREHTALVDHAEWDAVVRTTARSAEIAAILDAVEGFAHERIEILPVLADIAEALPTGTAIQRLEIDDGEGRLVLLASDAGRTLSALRNLPALSSVELRGNIGQSGSSHFDPLERLTIHFRLGQARQPEAPGTEGP